MVRNIAWFLLLAILSFLFWTLVPFVLQNTIMANYPHDSSLGAPVETLYKMFQSLEMALADVTIHLLPRVFLAATFFSAYFVFRGKEWRRILTRSSVLFLLVQFVFVLVYLYSMGQQVDGIVTSLDGNLSHLVSTSLDSTEGIAHLLAPLLRAEQFLAFYQFITLMTLSVCIGFSSPWKVDHRNIRAVWVFSVVGFVLIALLPSLLVPDESPKVWVLLNGLSASFILVLPWLFQVMRSEINNAGAAKSVSLMRTLLLQCLFGVIASMLPIYFFRKVLLSISGERGTILDALVHHGLKEPEKVLDLSFEVIGQMFYLVGTSLIMSCVLFGALIVALFPKSKAR